MRHWNVLRVMALALILPLSCRWIGEHILTTRKSEDYFVPSGYVGWIAVTYGVQSAPPLPLKDGRRLIRIPQSGRLDTSTRFESGSAIDHYYSSSTNAVTTELRSTPWGGGGSVWGEYTQCSRRTGRCLAAAFIGTEAQYRTDVKNSTPLPSLPPETVGE